jgi:hypothetical protein
MAALVRFGKRRSVEIIVLTPGYIFRSKGREETGMLGFAGM